MANVSVDWLRRQKVSETEWQLHPQCFPRSETSWGCHRWICGHPQLDHQDNTQLPRFFAGMPLLLGSPNLSYAGTSRVTDLHGIQHKVGGGCSATWTKRNYFPTPGQSTLLGLLKGLVPTQQELWIVLSFSLMDGPWKSVCIGVKFLIAHLLALMVCELGKTWYLQFMHINVYCNRMPLYYGPFFKK